MRYGLIGEKLGHSFSKEIHELPGRYEYELIEIPRDELEAFIRGRDYDGLNVTIPYKQAVMPYLDEISELASDIGAVNTIVNRDGKLTGYNTDFGGMEMLVKRIGTDISGRKVFIAGSGGTSLTAEKVCKRLGAACAVRASRSGRNGALTYEEAYRQCADAALLINTTPAGMYPDTGSVPLDIDRFAQPEGLMDVIYNPLRTGLVQEARAKGLRAENGLYMLVAQAMLAAELFTGEPVDAAETERIYDHLLSGKRSIVLTGMPGSGKTTLGRMLADSLGRELIETDEEIVREAGMPIREIFERYGEKYFRDLESDVIRRASERGGRVISTGGGAVLREENVTALRMNGTIVFLNRPPESLSPTGDRPLADDTGKIKALYGKRYPVYRETADLIVDIEGTEEESAEKIRRALRCE